MSTHEPNDTSVRDRLQAALVRGDIESFRQAFLHMHPTDQMDNLSRFPSELRQKVYYYLSPSEFADIFQEYHRKKQKSLIVELDDHYTLDVIDHMQTDDVVDFLSELSKEKRRFFLKRMDDATAQEVSTLLTYPEETAGAMMTTEFISISVEDKVERVLHRLRQEGPDAETIYYLYVTDQHKRLVGVVSLRELMTSPLHTQIQEMMKTKVIAVDVRKDQEEVAQLIQKYDLLAVPVIAHGRLVGIVTVDDVIDVIEEETTEDFEEISAAKGAVNLENGAWDSSKKRLPWLILLLFIGLITATIVKSFEETLERAVLLAMFIPMIADMAGNTGTQSLAVVVRGLALGKLNKETKVRLLKREAFTGVILGLVCGFVIMIISQVVTEGEPLIGFVIGLSLFFILVIATLAGAVVPLIINKFNIDPAVASGPFITTINDILGLLIYFYIATLLLGHLME
ncbi:magnesium transporter [Caldalkalibacillus salinus]|uniref:magnesium transporter n=1 Tax=Caldalkalibacillus salinus TaxID=2803787 RepID=UPI001924C9F9|nr:magnesium transporter [Caldalkalibacillus salinus]